MKNGDRFFEKTSEMGQIRKGYDRDAGEKVKVG
jgi:hypothetical protein